ncbi:MAG: phosphonate ABC transporter ATP-binding protein [Caldilineales bacterium]|nr:phosphonate ABC transporter ATP-binding protein [Caldilineales bacterium]
MTGSNGSALPVFALTNVTRRYGDLAALQDVSLEIGAGERVALVGPSGAGKSTMLRLLNGSLFPTQGRMQILGDDLSELPVRRLQALQRRIGFVHQDLNLVGNLRVIHNVNAGRLGDWSLPRALVSLAWPLGIQDAAGALERVGIPEKIYERTDRLSLGQQQRVAIARVLVQQPQAILADEPVSSLDPERSREVMDLLRDLNQETGVTLVVSLHDIGFARSHCDRIIGLRQGRMMFDTPAADLTQPLVESLYQLR